MVRKNGQRGAASRWAWQVAREAYEAGRSLEVVARGAGLKAATLQRRAEDEDWSRPQRTLRRLAHALDSEIARLDADAASAPVEDRDKRARALESLARAAERVAALYGAELARAASEQGGADGAASDELDAAEAARLRGALERRLAARLTEAAAVGVSEDADGPRVAGAGHGGAP